MTDTNGGNGRAGGRHTVAGVIGADFAVCPWPGSIALSRRWVGCSSPSSSSCCSSLSRSTCTSSFRSTRAGPVRVHLALGWVRAQDTCMHCSSCLEAPWMWASWVALLLGAHHDAGVVYSCCCAAASEPCAALALRGLSPSACGFMSVDWSTIPLRQSSPVEPLTGEGGDGQRF